MKTFRLAISTPDERFFAGEAEAVTLSDKNGALTVYADHAPMIVAFVEGEISIEIDGEWRSFLSTEGFAEVTGSGTVIFTRAAVWEDEADKLRTEKEKREALEELRHKKSVFEHEHTKIELTRALSRLGRSKKDGNI